MPDPSADRSSALVHADQSTRRLPDDPMHVEIPWDMVGRRLGRYMVLERLGAGGMGAVFAAYDASLDRKVAIKVLHGERAREDDQPRLWREAQALARLSHPNVVNVHEVGRSEDGAVFVAMEFVRGQSLGAWQRTAPGAREVLAAYVQAGRGLGAAHEAGLVHRDFKPDNAIRTEDGRVKVLDFGLARASGPSSMDTVTADRSSLSSSLTLEGTVMGTPPYMSPEQHEGRNVDARSDQYGFCVALWQGLTGERPFAATDLEALYEAKHEGPPPWPAGAPSLPRSLVEALRRGLAADPERRWPSMETLLAALRWEPERRRRRVMMGLGGLVVVGLGTAGAGAYVKAQAERCSGARAKLVGVWDEARRAEARAAVLGVERPYSARVWTRTEQALDEHARAWVAMHTEACEATAVRHEQSEARLELRMECLHRASVELRMVVDTLADADATVVDEAHELVAGLRPLSRCADTKALEAEVEPPLPTEADAVEQAREHLARARSERTAGHYEAALRALEAAKEVLKAVEYGPVRAERALEEGNVLKELGRYDATVQACSEAFELAVRWSLREETFRAANLLMLTVGVSQRRMEDALELWPVVRGSSMSDPLWMAEARDFLGGIFLVQGKYEEAERERRAALAARELALEPDHHDVTTSRFHLALVLDERGKYDEAEAELRLALASWEKALGPDHPNVATSRSRLANILSDQGKYDEAEVELRLALAAKQKALGPDHPDVAASRHDLANVFNAQGKVEEAEAEHRLALASLEKALGPDHPDVAASRNNLAFVLDIEGKYEEAEAQYRLAVAALEKALGPDHPDLAMARSNLAGVLDLQGKYEGVEAQYRLALASLEKALGPDHPNVATMRSNLAYSFKTQGKLEEAQSEHRLVLASRERTLGPEHPKVAQSRHNLALVLDAQGKLEEAKTELRVALASRERALGQDHPDVAVSRDQLARVLLEQGRRAEALPLAEQAWQRRRRDDVPPRQRAMTAFLLARLLWSIQGPQRDRARARVLAEDAASSYRAAEGDVAHALAEVEQWLSTHRLR